MAALIQLKGAPLSVIVALIVAGQEMNQAALEDATGYGRDSVRAACRKLERFGLTRYVKRAGPDLYWRAALDWAEFCKLSGPLMALPQAAAALPAPDPDPLPDGFGQVIDRLIAAGAPQSRAAAAVYHAWQRGQDDPAVLDSRADLALAYAHSTRAAGGRHFIASPWGFACAAIEDGRAIPDPLPAEVQTDPDDLSRYDGFLDVAANAAEAE